MDEAHGHALRQRGLSVEKVARLGWRPCAGPTEDLWISIPIVDQGRRIGTKYRTLSGPKLFTQDKGTPQIFWNVDCLRDPQLAGFPLVITEGEMDAVAAIQSGFPKTVSVPGGAPNVEQGVDVEWNYLTHAKGLLADQKLIVLATDADHNGHILRDGLSQRLGRSRCQIFDYPAGTKDLNDVLRASGEAAVRETISSARYIPLPGLMRLREMPERAPRAALDTCIPGLEPHMRIRRGDLIVVTGPPGHGKSSFVANLLCNMAWHWQTVAALASFETAVMPDLRRTLRTYRAECLEKFMSNEQKSDADDWINRHFVFLQGEEGEEMTLDWMLERFAAAHTRFDASICVIDPWNEVSVSGKPIEWTQEQFVSQSLRITKSFARTQDVTVIIVAHPAKMRRDRNGKTPKPGLWDIADSASWANRADLGVVVYRPDIHSSDDLTEISVEKSRDYYSIGTPGCITLKWQPEASRFIKPGW